MRKHLFELVAATALTIGAILALAPGVMASDVMVMGAFARASAVSTATSGVAYVTLMNHGAKPDRLLSISTPAADMAMLHESVEAGGVASMKEMSGLEIAPGGSVEMKPGGVHIMLMGLHEPLAKGATLKLTLTFEHAGKVDVDAAVGDVAQSVGGN